MAPYQLLDSFRELFDGQEYRHRRSNLGDRVAMRLYEDLYSIGRSEKLLERIESGLIVLNAQNRRQGIKARRGDGSFGEIIPNVPPIKDKGFVVSRGPIATIQIGIEVKILFKAMIKQIDRVINDLQKQVDNFRLRGGNPICVGIVGINCAAHCTSYEGDRAFPTGGKGNKHPVQEASVAEARLIAAATPAFDELLVLKFEATNVTPHPFRWIDQEETALNYGALLARVSQKYSNRF